MRRTEHEVNETAFIVTACIAIVLGLTIFIFAVNRLMETL